MTEEINLIRFEPDFGSTLVKGDPRYVEEDSAFDFRLAEEEREKNLASTARTSLVIDTLQLEVCVDSGLCLFAWGYCPIQMWRVTALDAPRACPGSLRIISATPLIAGISLGIEYMVLPTPSFDPRLGWFCMGRTHSLTTDQVVEFASESLAILEGARLASIWLRPENWAELRLAIGR